MTFGSVEITEGTGTLIGADTISSVEFQRVKLVSGLEGESDGIGGTAARGLYVDQRFNFYDQEQSSAGLTNAAYAAGEVLGTGWTFTSAARASGGSGYLDGVTIVDNADVITLVQLWFARASITFGTDNASPSISDADALKLLPISGLSVPLTDLGGVKVGAVAGDIGRYFCDATSLFVYATTPIALAGGWSVATDLKIHLSGILG